jgi:DNA-binding MarR family transcriptional regulator/GNAT superfamily N-acetyltransferase
MDRALVDQVRSFNRAVTERVGALDDSYLGRGRPLGETRLLWEIGADGADVRDLRRRLGIDPGYASRLLRSLEARGLVVVESSGGDRRVRRVRLTRRGRTERAQLDRLSNELAAAMLEGLDEPHRVRLADAMGDVERLLRASEITIAAVDPAGADARWCLEQYFAELAVRFDGGFDPGLSTAPDPQVFAPPAGALLVAYSREQPVGCGGLRYEGAAADVKRMWVAPAMRGLGLGRRLLRELERHAAAAGAAVVRLETNRALTEAIGLYRREGFAEVEPFNDERYADHWFAKRLHP